MKRRIVVSLLAGILCAAAAASVSAQSAMDSQLSSNSTALNSEGSSAGGAAAAIQAIESTFGVTSSQIAGLRSSGLGYGEIVIALSLAQTMTGGLTTSNINAVVAMHQGPPEVGWGQIARNMGLDLGKLVSKVRTEVDDTKEIEVSSAKEKETEKDSGHSATAGQESEHPEGSGSGSGSGSGGSASGDRR